MHKFKFILFTLFALLSAGPAPATETMETYAADGEYGYFRESLQQAIANQGLVISGISHMSEMLERTGKDLGATRTVYREAEIFEFCSAVLSRNMVEADPRNIAFCPFAISLYALPEEPGKVYATFRRPAVLAPEHSVEALEAAENMLRKIVREALELDF